MSATKAHQTYKLPDGTKVPGGSTIAKLAYGGDALQGLINWAAKCGADGLDPAKVRDKAGNIGTCAHLMNECYVQGQAADLGDFTPNDVKQAQIAHDNFRRWWDASGLEFVCAEIQLVHQKKKYGGTLDLVARDPKNGDIILLDHKTSKDIYHDHVCQLAGYERLWNEAGLEMVGGAARWRNFSQAGRTIVRRLILRLGKDDPNDFEAREFGDLKKYLAVFDKALALYYAKKKVGYKVPQAEKSVAENITRQTGGQL